MGEGRLLKKLEGIAGQVNAIESHYEAMSDSELASLTTEYKQRSENGEAKKPATGDGTARES